MGKVYLKTKYDNEMKMEIPHNHNFASAMFGFREMAAEIVPYHLIDDIYDDFKREDIALDYIDQCNVLFNKFGVTPHIPDYPDVLKPFLGRKIWKDTINSISRDENKWSAGYFVKPAVRSKAFTGKTISSIKDLMGCGNHAEDYEVLVSESLDIAAEWRCFITYDEIIDVRPYGMIIDKSRKGYLYHYDAQVLNSMMESFVSWEDRPMACSMDICVTKDFSLFAVPYAYVDHSSYLADQLFVQNKITMKFKGEMVKDGSSYCIVFCKVLKKDVARFEEALERLKDKMLLLGHKDYPDACGEIAKMIEEDMKARMRK